MDDKCSVTSTSSPGYSALLEPPPMWRMWPSKELPPSLAPPPKEWHRQGHTRLQPTLCDPHARQDISPGQPSLSAPPPPLQTPIHPSAPRTAQTANLRE